ncbi:serine protease [Luteibacter sp. OK325]|uniref:S8 family serine peptidase n=1 Tax=Luteibacter sp. OK325 TaxID=2135670 RepID=UPI000D4B8A38|nr:S8 family serine peptidase [Luteibacter sp. OK325]PTR26377.1 serine protease [Luteibacter sp. OK325]
MSKYACRPLGAVMLGLAVSAPVVAADETTNRYIVHFDDSVTANAATMEAVHAMAQHGSPAWHVRRLAAGGELFELSAVEAEAMAASKGVVAVEEDLMVSLAGSIIDPLWRRQWYMHDPKVGIEAPVAWRDTRGEGAVVAVLDTGVTPHPEFDGQLLPGYDFITDAQAARDGDGRDADPTDEGDWTDPGDCHSRQGSPSSWHGTHVTGIVVARAGNTPGIVGVAPQAKVVPVRVMGRCGGRLSDVADAIVWASGGEVAGIPGRAPVDVINLSLRVPGACSMTMGRAIAQARARGTSVVAAAGNDSIKASGVSPANCPGVVSVAALARDGSMAWYSNYGDGVTVAAPGGSLGRMGIDDILSSVDGGERGRQRPIFKYYAGTSMAAPQVAGLVALMRSADPLIGVDEITAQLIDNARPLPGPCPKGCGAGLIDAGATVDAVIEDSVLPRPRS